MYDIPITHIIVSKYDLGAYDKPPMIQSTGCIYLLNTYNKASRIFNVSNSSFADKRDAQNVVNIIYSRV